MFGFNYLWNISNNSNCLNDSDKAKYENDYLFSLYFTILANMALSLIEWEGLPEELEKEKRYMNMVIVLGGPGVLYKEEEFDKFNFLQLLPNGNYDMHGNLINFSARGYNGYHKQLTSDKGVIFYSSYSRIPVIAPIIYQYAKRIADVQRTIDVRLEHHKIPVIFKATKNTLLSFKNLFKKRTNNEPVAYIDDAMDYGASLAMPTDPAFIIKDLYSYKKDLINEFFSWVGIDNAKTDKKERMIESEVKSNYEQIYISRDSMLTPLNDACEEANKKWGLNISVKFRTEELTKIFNEFDKIEENIKGGEINDGVL